MATYTPDEVTRGVIFAWAYQRKLRAYLRRPDALAFGRGGPGPDDPAFIHCVLAARLADRLGVSYADYVEAHFHAEHRWRGRHPEVRFLHRQHGWTSAERVATWQRARGQRGGLARAIAPGTAASLSAAETATTQERYLRQLCARWRAGKADIFYALGAPGAGVFDPGWLRSQPLWRALDARGHFRGRHGADIAYLRELRDQARMAGARP